tara:strand:+ start:249 stop:839 length:591 start_codon:yes stop_codon:yes gene_type:complete
MMVNLFPTCLYKADLPEYVQWVSRRYDHHEFNEGLTGELDGQVLVHLDPQLASFFFEISDHVHKYLAEMKCVYDVHFMKTWYTITDQDNPVPSHCHDPAHISWVYYLEADDPLCFSNDSPNEWFPEAFAHTEKNFFNTSVWEENTAPGNLLIFPAKLRHHTYNTGPRFSLAGDILLTNTDLNREGGLTNPKYWKSF